MAIAERILQKAEKKNYFWIFLLNVEGSFTYKFTSKI